MRSWAKGGAVLTEAKLAAIVPVRDLEQAIAFYEQRLGLRLVERRDAADPNKEAHFEVGAANLVVYESVGAGQSRHTLVGFQVENVEAAVAALREKGVVFEEYDLPNLKTVDGVAQLHGSKGAWFKDPDGNILAVETPAAP
jgi:catechol 2,3-dioxygenase-like lactoylglutathione lyase family enzyme